MIAILDIEACGLGPRSWPVEVAWVLEDGTGESHLIRPAPGWDAADWEPEAEEVHGIPLARLLAEGEDAGAVARRAAEALGAAEVHADSTKDGWWLSRLTDLLPGAPRLRVGDYETLLVRTAATGLVPGPGPHGRLDVLYEATRRIGFARTAVHASFPYTHRALDDARHLWAVWKQVRWAAGLDPEGPLGPGPGVGGAGPAA